MSTMNDLLGLANIMKSLQERKETLEEQLKALNMELDGIRLKEIPEMMAELEVKNVTFEGLGRVQLAADLYCTTKAGQKEAAMQWLRDCGYENMIAENYNASSMKALVRRLIEDGTETPEFLNVTPFMRASLVKV